MSKDTKLECIIKECFELINLEAVALEENDLERISEIIGQKDDSVSALAGLLQEDSSLSQGQHDAVRKIYDGINANTEKLDALIEKTDKELALLSRGRNRLRGLRNSYVTVPREGYLDRSNRFEA